MSQAADTLKKPVKKIWEKIKQKKPTKSFKKSIQKFINSGEFFVQSRKYFIKDLTWQSLINLIDECSILFANQQTMPKVMTHRNVLLKADHPIVVVDYHS